MRKIIVSVILVLTFLCSPAMGETAMDWFRKADALSDGRKYTDPQKAIQYLNKGIQLQPDHPLAYYSRGIAYAGIGQHKLAVEDFTRAIRLQPNNALAFINRGIAYDNLGQEQLAIQDYSEAIRLKPDYTEAYNNRGIDYLSRGNRKLGCADAQKACRLGNCTLLGLAKRQGDCR